MNGYSMPTRSSSGCSLEDKPKEPPELYAMTAMFLAIGALRTLPQDNTGVGLIIRQLEIAIDKLKQKPI